MAKKSVKAAKLKKKLSVEAQEEVRFLELAISNHERCMAGATNELKIYFQQWIEKNQARLTELTGK